MTDDQKLLSRALFCRSVHIGSLHQACKDLGVDRAQGRGFIRELERSLGITLLIRSNAGVRPTADGSRFYQRWQPALAKLEQLTQARVSEQQTRINISMPTTTGTTLLMPIIARYATEHPDVLIDTRFTHGSFHPLWDGVDLRIGHSEYRLEDVQTHFLGRVKRIAVASPSYIEAHPMPSRPEELTLHSVFGARDAVEKRALILTKGKKTSTVFLNPQVIVRNHMASLSAAISHQGIALLVPVYLARPFMQRGELVQVLQDWHFPSLKLQAFTRTGSLPEHLTGIIHALQHEFIVSDDLETS